MALLPSDLSKSMLKKLSKHEIIYFVGNGKQEAYWVVGAQRISETLLGIVIKGLEPRHEVKVIGDVEEW